MKIKENCSAVWLKRSRTGIQLDQEMSNKQQNTNQLWAKTLMTTHYCQIAKPTWYPNNWERNSTPHPKPTNHISSVATNTITNNHELHHANDIFVELAIIKIKEMEENGKLIAHHAFTQPFAIHESCSTNNGNNNINNTQTQHKPSWNNCGGGNCYGQKLPPTIGYTHASTRQTTHLAKQQKTQPTTTTNGKTDKLTKSM